MYLYGTNDNTQTLKYISKRLGCLGYQAYIGHVFYFKYNYLSTST